MATALFSLCNRDGGMLESSALLARNCCMHAFYILHCIPRFINYVVWMVAIVWFVCRGVICLLKVVDGSVVKGDRVIASSTGEVYDVLEVTSSTVENPSPPPPSPPPCPVIAVG